MKLFSKLIILKFAILCLSCIQLTSAITMEQFEQSLDMMRNGCAPKFKVSLEQLDKLRNGYFDESSSELKCYTKCVAQLAGTVTKKGDFSISKATAQIPIILPPEIQETAKAALASCKEIQKDYKESCDRIFYVTKCVRDFAPDIFKFP
uniref:Odorant binding protein n=1 Tax=Calliphora stygia TaxID=145453 RepID=A0A068F5P4_CALSG|nr:odorant binding protein [Calliphora stygia]